jgi:hypothetical protein
MNSRDESEEYNAIFDAARLNASIRIQELDDAVEISGLNTMVKLLRPNESPPTTIPQDSRLGTNKRAHPGSSRFF